MGSKLTVFKNILVPVDGSKHSNRAIHDGISSSGLKVRTLFLT